MERKKQLDLFIQKKRSKKQINQEMKELLIGQGQDENAVALELSKIRMQEQQMSARAKFNEIKAKMNRIA